MPAVASSGEFWNRARLWESRGLITTCLLLGALLGTATGFSLPQTFTAENRLAVGTGSVSDLNIPGFPTASAAIASNYARWIDNAATADIAADGVIDVTASPFPDSNVLRLEITASSRGKALSEADRLGDDLVSEVKRVNGGNDPDDLLDEVADRSDAVAQTQLDVDRARAGLQQAQEAPVPDDRIIAERRRAFVRANRLNITAQLVVDGLQDRYRRLVANRSSEADVTVLTEKSYISRTSRNEAMQRYALLGMGIGGLMALVLVRRRAGRRSSVSGPSA